MSDNDLMQVLGGIPSGLFILTCKGKSQNHGMLVSWVQQAGFSPPALSVAVKQDRPIMRDFKPGAIFCLSGLSQDDAASKKLMAAFSRGTAIGEDAFVGQTMAAGEYGGVYLAEAVSYMECRLMRVLEPSTDHNLVVGEVIGGRMLRQAKSWVHIRKSGDHY